MRLKGGMRTDSFSAHVLLLWTPASALPEYDACG